MTHDPGSPFQHHRTLLETLYKHCQSQPPFNTESPSELDQELMVILETLKNATHQSEQFTELGQLAITRIISHYPHITPAVNRDLFWFFGGDCLHYMGDDEIERYQQLDEYWYEQQNSDEPIDFATAKSRVFKLH